MPAMKLSHLAIVLGCLVCISLGFPYSTTERKTLTYYPSNNFYILGQSLQSLINEAKKRPVVQHSSGTVNVELMLQQLSGYKLHFNKAEEVMVHDRVIAYHIPQVFTFDIEVNYVLTYAVMPLSGVCTLRLTVEDATYTLDVQEKTIVPNLEGKWKLEIFNITNSVAIHLGARSNILAALPSIEGYFNPLIKQILQTDVKHFYEDYFGTSNYYIHFPYFRNTSITLTNKFDKLSVANIARDPIVIASYDQYTDPVPSAAIPKAAADDFLRSISIDVQNLARVVEWEIYLTQNMVLTHDSIPANCIFQADAKSAARIFPDLLQEFGNAPLKLTFTGQSTRVSAKYCLKHGAIELEGAVFTMTAALDGAEAPLFRASFSVEGRFKPNFVKDPEDSKRVFMNLEAEHAEAKVLAKEKLWDNQDALFNEDAIDGYINDMVSGYFVQSLKLKTMGTGMLLSFGFPINHERTTFESDNEQAFKVY